MLEKWDHCICSMHCSPWHFPTILNSGKFPYTSFCWSSLNQHLTIHGKKEQLCLHILMNKDLLFKHSHYKWKSCWWACKGSALSDWEQLTFCPYHTCWFLPLRKAKDYHTCLPTHNRNYVTVPKHRYFLEAPTITDLKTTPE